MSVADGPETGEKRRKPEWYSRLPVEYQAAMDRLPDVLFQKLTSDVDKSLAEELSREFMAALQPLPDPQLLDLSQEPPDFEWVIEGILPDHREAGLFVVAGAEKAFKSHVAICLGASIATGKPFLGAFSVPRRQKVLMVLGEGGSRMNHRRTVRYLRGLGLTDDDLAEVHEWLRVSPTAVTDPRVFNRFLRQQVLEFQPDIVIVDCLYVYAGSTERQLTSMPAAVKPWQVTCEEAGAGLVLLDHFRKHETKLELGSISGVGLTTMVRAWLLVRCEEWDSENDKAVLTTYSSGNHSVEKWLSVQMVGGDRGVEATMTATPKTRDEVDDEKKKASMPLEEHAERAVGYLKWSAGHDVVDPGSGVVRPGKTPPAVWVSKSELVRSRSMSTGSAEATRLCDLVMTHPRVAAAVRGHHGPQPQWRFAYVQDGDASKMPPLDGGFELYEAAE